MSLASFHPAVRSWFEARFGEPTEPQREGWPSIREGRHTLIAAPTGSGKTLAAFLSAIDSLFRGGELPDETRVVYVSPLRALSNDVQKNLQGPLSEIRAADPTLPEIRVLVRTGDTPQSERTAMARRPPHILVTTPESLYLLLTSEGGRGVVQTVRTVIVDEIHALARDKRGSHLALSLERLEALAGRPVQRIGLSATQKPLERTGRSVGEGRECTLVDAGTFRDMDMKIEVPPSPLSSVCSHEQWEEIYLRIAELVREHRTTLVFVNTRKMAERIAGQLTKLLGEDAVTSHHGSLSRERRLNAEERLKAGKLRALVATASLELGIDIGDVDLAIQVGATRSIATLLQRVGRAGHAVKRVPKGRLFPLTLDDLVEGAALLRCVRGAILDASTGPSRPSTSWRTDRGRCVGVDWGEAALFELMKRRLRTDELCARSSKGSSRCSGRRRRVSIATGGQRGPDGDEAGAAGGAAVRRRHPGHRGLPGAPEPRGHGPSARSTRTGPSSPTPGTSSSSATRLAILASSPKRSVARREGAAA